MIMRLRRARVTSVIIPTSAYALGVLERNLFIHKRLLAVGLLLYGIVAVVWIGPAFERDLVGSRFLIVLGLAIYGVYALVTTLVIRLAVGTMRGSVFVVHAATLAVCLLAVFGVR